MTYASARASPLVVIAQHTNGRPIKRHGSPDGLTGVKDSQNPTVRKNIGPASRGGQALAPLGHAGGSPA
jgi:hypothetical protein